MGGLNSMSLTHNTKLPKSFNSAIWKKGCNPDLIFVSLNISDMCEKSVLDPILCNLKKANWDGVSTEFDAAIEEVN